jgi:hypothetical protein
MTTNVTSTERVPDGECCDSCGALVADVELFGYRRPEGVAMVLRRASAGQVVCRPADAAGCGPITKFVEQWEEVRDE